ncbi:lipoprotein LpqV [Mycobacterium sp. NPDC003323]
MRRFPITVYAVAATVLLAGCGSEAPESPSTPSAAPTSTTEAPRLPAEAAPTGGVRVSPDGVTTVVDVPSEATESQYGQACLAAKRWFDEHREPVEAYLKTVQADGAVGPGSFDQPWVELTPAQQAGVIMAANAAARGECG